MEKVILGITASIAAFKCCDIIRLLRKKGYAVKCVMTPNAEKFVTRTTLETLSGETVAKDMFERPEKMCPGHISLAEEADLMLIAPATANIIGKIASGICDDTLTCAVCAASCPTVFAPAMNDKMYNNPIVRDKMDYLAEKGYYFIEPVEGALACGSVGMGHLAPPEKIVEEVEKILLCSRTANNG